MISMLYQDFRRPLWRQHPCATALVVFGGVWLLLHGWYLTVAIAAFIALATGVSRRRRAEARRRAGLRARAELEHRMALAGDPRGVYGRYPPVQSGWFPDPHNRRQLRYFDGTAWTGHAHLSRADASLRASYGL
jgi:hypothetical protein